MNISVLQSSLTPEYEDYLLKQETSLLYYGHRYKDFLKALLGCEEEYLIATENDEIRGVLPLLYAERDGRRVYNSLPYYGSNGGILTQDAAAFGALSAAYDEIARSERTLSATVISNPLGEVDLSNLSHNYKDYRIGQLTNISFKENHRERLMSVIDSTAVRNIKKAAREEIEIGTDAAEFGRLREIHEENMQAIGGLAKSERFFALIPEHFEAGRDFDLYVARKEGLVIAALLIFYFNHTVEYFTPAIDSRYRSIQPLSLILIEAMTAASRRGFRWWNWGGTWGSQTGVYRFKKKWGAEERNYYYFTQLNDESVLDWTPKQALEAFPNFFLLPFSALKSQTA
jgi:hypothetical protein